MDSTDSRTVARRLFTYLFAVRGKFILSLVFLLLAASLTAAKAWIIQPTVDSFLQGPTGHAQLRFLCAIVLAIFTAQAVFNWLYLVVARMVSAHIVQAIRADLFHHLTRHSLGYFAKHPSSDLISRVINDITVFDWSAVSALQGVIRNGLTLMLLLAVMLIQEFKWGLLCFLVMLVAGFLLRSMGSRIVLMARAVQESVSKVTHHLTEMIGGIAVILSFDVAKRWHARFSETNKGHYEWQVKSTRIRASATALVDLITGATLAGLLLWTGSALLNGELTEGQLLSFLAVMFLMQAPAQRLAHLVAGLSHGFAAGARAFELFDQKPEIRDSEHPRPLPVGDGTIEFRDVSFAYDHEPVLENLSFQVMPRELVAMVGRSGAGKSTVAKLAQRFYDPLKGQVLVNGVDLREIRRDDLHRAVSYVAQDVFLFDDTIESNLNVGVPDATAAQLDDAIRLACLEDLIDELPDGLQTVVGERGVRLSGGQQQRIAIARAILTEAEILVLDEATSALDMHLERRILQNLVSDKRARTIFAISHRLTLAEIADRVLVLRDGKLVEQGDRESLIAAGGEFSFLQLAAEAQLVR